MRGSFRDSLRPGSWGSLRPPRPVLALAERTRRSFRRLASRVSGLRANIVFHAGYAPPDNAIADARRAAKILEHLLAEGWLSPSQVSVPPPLSLASLRRVHDSVGDRWWSAGFDPVGWLGSGRAALASAWHHRVVAGNWDGLGLTIVWRQGMLVADRWGVPAAAENADVAADLVRYALTPEVQAALASVLPLGPVVPEAFGLVDPFVAATLPTDPSRVDQLFVPDAAWWAANRAEARRRIAEVVPLAAPVSG